MVDSTIVGGDANNTIVFVDFNYADDYQGLLRQDAQYELVLLDLYNQNGTGMEQISEALSLKAPGSIDSMHIFSKGELPYLRIGAERVDYKDVSKYYSSSSSRFARIRDQITGWGEALSDNADILIYGSNVASSTRNTGGDDAMQLISNLTGADVAASDDTTGVGGDFVLEYSTGSIESPLLINPSWNGDLGIDDGRPNPGFWSQQLWMGNPHNYSLNPRQFTASNMFRLESADLLNSGDLRNFVSKCSQPLLYWRRILREPTYGLL